MSETMNAMWQPLTRVSCVQQDASAEIEIEFGWLPNTPSGAWCAQHGVVMFFRREPIEAICALVEYLAS